MLSEFLHHSILYFTIVLTVNFFNFINSLTKMKYVLVSGGKSNLELSDDYLKNLDARVMLGTINAAITL